MRAIDAIARPARKGKQWFSAMIAVFATMAILVFIWSYSGQERPSGTAEIERTGRSLDTREFRDVSWTPRIEAIERSLHARDFQYDLDLWDGLDAYRTAFASVGRNEIKTLKTHAATGIALRASWEEVRRDLNVLPHRPDVLEGSVQRFLASVERRIGINVPAFWETGIRRRLPSQEPKGIDGRTFFQEAKYEPGLELWCDRDVRVRYNANDVILVRGGNSIEIPMSTVKANESGIWSASAISILFNEAESFLAKYGNFGSPYDLHCLDGRLGSARWKATVWGGTGMVNIIGGPVLQEVTIREDDAQIVVFGASSTGAVHIEGFRKADGSVVFRFSTEY